MKHLLTKALVGVAMIGTSVAANAELYNLQLDTPLELPAMQKAELVFTASDTGTLTVSCSNNQQFAVYSPYVEGKEYSMDPEVDPQYPYDFLSIYPCKFKMEVEAGQTYYFLASFPMSKFTVTASMGVEAPEIKQINPTPGTAFPITGAATLDVQFNTATLKADKCVVKSGNNEAELPVYSHQGWLIVEYPNTIYQWLVEDETIQPGDDVTLTISGIQTNEALCASASYNGEELVKDGVMTLTYKVPSKPTVFLNCSKADGEAFMSYYKPGDPAGMITYTFSGPVFIDEANVLWRYGSAELAGKGFATGQLPIQVNGNVITVDATGVVRNMAELAPDAPEGMDISVHLMQVKDADGNYIYMPGQGAVGSVTSFFAYTQVPRINVLADFTPASGSSIDNANEITIWVSPFDEIEYSAVNFAYEKDGNTINVHSTAVADESQKDEDGFVPIKASIPAEVRGKGNITVTLANLKAFDGQNHAADVRAVYTSTVSVFNVVADNRNEDGICPSLESFTIDYADGIKLANTTTTQYIQLYDMDRQEVARVAVDAQHMTVANNTVKFSLDEPIIKDGEYVMIVPAGVFLLGADETANSTFTGRFTLQTPEFAVANGVKVSPNFERVQEELVRFTMEWIVEKYVVLNNDATGYGVFDAAGTLVSELDVTAGTADNLLNVQLLKPITTTGTYTVKFPAASFLYGTESDVESTAIEFTYNVVAKEQSENAWDKVTYDPDPATELTSLKEFVMTWPECETAGVSNDFVDVKVAVRNQAGSEAAQASIEWGEEMNQLKVVLDKEITTSGEYTLIFPAGMFNFNDDEANVNKQFSVTYFIKKKAGSEGAYEYLPNPAETQTSLSHIVMTFKNESAVGFNGETDFDVTDASGAKVTTAVGGYDFSIEDFNVVIFDLQEEITADGTYTITFPAGSFAYNDDPDNVNEEAITVTYVVSHDTGVTMVITDDTEVMVYDLAGRQVRKGMGAEVLNGLRGIYVVNGKKVVLK